MFAAILRASSLVSSLAAERRPGSFSKIDVSELLSVSVAHDVVVRLRLGSPRRREAAGHERKSSARNAELNGRLLRKEERAARHCGKLFKSKICSLESEHAVQVPFMQPPAWFPRYLVEPKEEQS